MSPAQMDARWGELGNTFEPWLDWSGLEEERVLGWRQHWALFTNPFYEVTYILANLGALQLWAASERDPAGTWARYTSALARGNTLPLADLYHAAGAQLPFDEGTVRSVVAFTREQFTSASEEPRAL